MQTQTITRDDVIELIRRLPLMKLARVYDFARFIEAQPLTVADEEEASLAREFAMWEAASDADYQKLERSLETA